jgi:hypothetical protein
MNFYSCGQLVARIEFDRKGTPKLKVHRKYVTGSPDGGPDYVKLLTGQECDPQGEICAWGGASMLRSWIANSEKHRGPEKCDVERAVAQMPTVIDLEMGLPAREGSENTAAHGHGGAGAKRRRRLDRLLGSEDDQRQTASLPDQAEGFRAGERLRGVVIACHRGISVHHITVHAIPAFF